MFKRYCHLIIFILCSWAQLSTAQEPIQWPSLFADQVINPYDLSVAHYLAKAEQQQGSDKQNFLLLAAGRLISEHQGRQGVAILAHTSHLTAGQQDEKNLLLAKADLLVGRAEAALNKVHAISNPDSFSLYNQIQYHEALAQAYRLTAKSAPSLIERIKLETLLTEEQEVLNNRRILWLTLINMPQKELSAMQAESAEDSDLQGWLQLALISQQYRTAPQALLVVLKEWQAKFAVHPANYMLPSSLDSIADKIMPPPKKIALLLPLTGSFAGPGNAIRDGFMAAQQVHKEQQPLDITFYDTEQKNAVALYQQAVNDGADYIVGPLIKQQVAQVAHIPHPVPTLLLNDAEHLQPNSYAYGLSSTNEALQVATQASSKGYKKALIFAPNNEWGSEVVNAFSKEWRQQGGSIVDIFHYNVAADVKEDFNKKIRDFLQVNNSLSRERQIKELLGASIQSVPSHRQDFDMIFLLAYPSKARQIIPALNYYYVNDVPVYATSTVYSGTSNAAKDKDLDGLIFCDIPWVFSHQMAAKNWPEQFNSYNRLYALGLDSYALANQLNQLIIFSADSSSKEQGILYLKPSQQVTRVLQWGQFKDGIAHSLG